MCFSAFAADSRFVAQLHGLAGIGSLAATRRSLRHPDFLATATPHSGPRLTRTQPNGEALRPNQGDAATSDLHARNGRPPTSGAGGVGGGARRPILSGHGGSAGENSATAC